ncbi:MAG: hypothetical protein IPH44_17900 [Myxococcales bacterium]|jgi:hypothetical protein|nr:hypothetical protein [Myxococcales bacterium]MBK7196781.1 hypothetical protein [Myxococcales bacterium]
MVRRRWPDVVIVIAVLGIGAGGVWALWGDRFREKSKPAAPTSTETSTPGL